MSIATSLIDGLFGLAKAALTIGGTLLIVQYLMHAMSTGFTRGKHRGQLPILSLRRWTCRHRLSHYTAGEHGLWAYWCADCGAKVNRK